MNEIQRSMNSIKASEELKADTLRCLEERRSAGNPGRRHGAPRFAFAFVCLLLLLGTGGYSFYGRPVSYVSIDINPSIELGINRLGRVVSVNAYNEDGQQILAQIKLKNLPYPRAVRKLLDYETAENYITENSLLVFTVISENAEAITQGLAGISSPQGTSVLTYVSDRSCMKEAHRHEMSFGKYRAYLELSGYDESVTLEECHKMTMGEIQSRIECCHSHGGVQSQAPSEDDSLDAGFQEENFRDTDSGNCGRHGGHGEHHGRGR